jgi:hypothetical protein
MKTYGGVEYSSNILDYGTRWRRVVSVTLRPLYPEKEKKKRRKEKRDGKTNEKS